MKPILFNTEMVRAILDGRKTQTRRVVKVNLRNDEAGWQVITNKHTGEFIRIETYDEWEDEVRWINPPYCPGDILYVRETWFEYAGQYVYKATAAQPELWNGMWRPSIHMPKEAARIFLRVTDVRVERLRSITEVDAEKEGFFKGWRLSGRGSLALSARQAFMWLWETITRDGPAAETWACNPWVWVIEFERYERPVEVSIND